MFEDTRRERSGLNDSHNLLPSEIRSVIPPLYAQEHSKDPMVYAKLFTPDSSFTWYATEGEPDGNDFRFFGYVVGQEKEWGYFLLSELQSVRGPFGLQVERDLHFTPVPISTVEKEAKE